MVPAGDWAIPPAGIATVTSSAVPKAPSDPARVSWKLAGTRAAAAIPSLNTTCRLVTGGSTFPVGLTDTTRGPATGTIRSRAAAALTRPPVVARPARAGIGTAESRIAARISAIVAWGFAAASNPATPATCGAAIEVPL